MPRSTQRLPLACIRLATFLLAACFGFSILSQLPTSDEASESPIELSETGSHESNDAPSESDDEVLHLSLEHTELPLLALPLSHGVHWSTTYGIELPAVPSPPPES